MSMGIPMTSHRKVLADGSVQVKTVTSLVPLFLPIGMLTPIMVSDFLEALGAPRWLIAGWLFFSVAAMCVSVFFPPSRTFFFDVAKQQLRVSERKWLGPDLPRWSLDFASISKVWLVHDGPKASEQAVVMLLAKEKTDVPKETTYALFKVGGYWLTSSVLEDIRRAMQGTTASVDTVTSASYAR